MMLISVIGLLAINTISDLNCVISNLLNSLIDSSYSHLITLSAYLNNLVSECLKAYTCVKVIELIILVQNL